MRLKVCNKAKHGFTRLELVVVLLTITLLGTVAFSVLGNTFTRTDLAVCSNNLRQIGRAFQMWASDHGGENPWWTPYTSGGSFIPPGGPLPPGNSITIPGAGLLPVTLRNQVWFQFGFIGEELRTPALLVCPSDAVRVRAQTFSSNSTNGYFHPNFQTRANSYFIGAHALQQFPFTMLSGDRSIKDHGQNSSCLVNVGGISVIYLYGSQGWTTTLHPISGNLLLNDGRVEEMTVSKLGIFLSSQNDDGGSTHLIKPQ